MSLSAVVFSAVDDDYAIRLLLILEHFRFASVFPVPLTSSLLSRTAKARFQDGLPDPRRRYCPRSGFHRE